MLEFLKTKTSPIGLDIGSNSVKMLQLQVKGDRIVVIAADEAQVASEVSGDNQERTEAAAAAIRNMLAKNRFRNRDVISCVPSSDLIIKSIRLDTCDEREIEKGFQAGMVEHSGLKAETHEIRFMCAGSVRQGEEVKNEVIIFAVDKGVLNNHINILDKAGVTLLAIDTVPSALFRILQKSLRRSAGQEKTNVFVDVGSSHTTVIIGKANEIIFTKQINIASEQINRQISAKLGISFDDAIHLRNKLKDEIEANEIEPATKQVVVDSMYSIIDDLAREISLCLRYYAVTFRGQWPGRVVFAGGEAYEEILTNAIRRHLGVEIEVTEPLKGFDISRTRFASDKKTILCEWAVAAGLCLKGLNLTDKQRVYERN